MLCRQVKIAALSMAIGAGALSARPQQASAQTFNPQTQLINSQPTPGNPSGQFSFGTITGLDPATFTTSNLLFDESIAGTGLDAFENTNPGTFDPNILFNDTGAAVSVADFTLQPNEIGFNPSGGPVVIRFTAPTAGPFQVDASFFGIQTVNADAQALVFSNGTQLFSEVADTDGTTFSSVLNLAAGDTVDFVVAGDTTNFGNRTTRLVANLAVVPEPTSLALLGLGSLALAARRRRR